MRILLIDDDPKIQRILQVAFQEEGHHVIPCLTGEEGLGRAEAAEGDLLIVDIGLPGMSGLDLVARLREEGDSRPVIFLTAEASEQEVVRGLDLGADGYVTKPFSVAELKARVRALAATRERARLEVLALGDLEIDRVNRTISRGGRTTRVTEVEHRILVALVEAGGEAVSREGLLEGVWSIPFDPGTSILDTHLTNLRKKLRSLGGPLIKNVRGVGWRILIPED